MNSDIPPLPADFTPIEPAPVAAPDTPPVIAVDIEIDEKDQTVALVLKHGGQRQELRMTTARARHLAEALRQASYRADGKGGAGANPNAQKRGRFRPAQR